MANNIVPLYKNKDLTQKYLNTLYKLNASSKHPGYFCSFAMTKDKQKPKPRFKGDDGNYFSQNPVDFYDRKLMDVHNHNWFSLTTFRHYNHQDLVDIENNIKRVKNSPNRGSKNNKKNYYHFKHLAYLIKSKVYPTRRQDKYTANFLGNYIDVDCMQNGVNPKDLRKHLHKAIKQHKMLAPTAIQDSGHGLYMIYLYNKPFTLSNDTNKRRKQFASWKRTEQVLVRHFNVFTGHWFGKELGDIKSTNPARILRGPNTMNVKVNDNGVHFAHPYTSYILEYPGVQHSFPYLSNYLSRFAPQFQHAPGLGGLLHRRQRFTDIGKTKDVTGNFWDKINTAVTYPGNPKYDNKAASKQIRADKLKINHYRYGTYHPRRRSPYHQGALKGFNQFNLVDFLEDHGIHLIRTGQDFVVTTVNNGYHSRDKNSIAITQKPNIYSKQYKLWKQGKISKKKVPTYSQLSRTSNAWGNVIGNYFKGNKRVAPNQDGGYSSSEVKLLKSEGYRKPDSITAWIMASKNIPFKEAKKKRLKWFQKYAAKGYTRTAYSWTDYGTADVGATNNSKINYSKASMQDILAQSYKDPIEKLYAKQVDKRGLYNSALLDDLNTAHQKLKTQMSPMYKQEYLNKQKHLVAQINKNKRGQNDVKRWINTKVVNNDIARNYLIHQRCLPRDEVNKLIKRRLVVGINGYYSHPVVKDKKGRVKKVHPYMRDIKGNVAINPKTHKPMINKATTVPLRTKKPVWNDPRVEFVQRVPRNAAESHSFTKPNYSKQDTWERDLDMTEHRRTRYQVDKKGKRMKNGRTVPKFIPKAGTQEEVPCGADFIYLRKTNQTYTDKNGRKHQIFDKDMNVNSSGKGIDNDKHRLRNYGFNFRNGTGKKRLFIFEAPIDAISFYCQHKASKDPKDKAEIKDATFLALSGSGQKVNKTVQNFMKHQFAYDNDFSHLISCTDNDYAGYQVPLLLAGKYGDIKEYVKHRKPNQRLVTVELPQSNDRPKGQEVLRSQANVPNKGQKGSFNKDWNAKTQSEVRYGKKFKSAGYKMNMLQFCHVTAKNIMVDIGSANSVIGKHIHQSHEQSIEKAKRDIAYADAYVHLAAQIYHNATNNGNEEINSTNPRTERMAEIQKRMSPGLKVKTADGRTKVIASAQNAFKDYMKDVGEKMKPDEIAKTMDNTYKEWFHENNSLLTSEQFKQDMNKSHTLPKIQQKVNSVMNRMPDNRSKRLYATAINSTANIWKRHIYHDIHDIPRNRYRYNRKYRNIIRKNHEKPIYPSFPEIKNVYKAQNYIDNQMRRSSLGRLYKDYPKQFHQAVDTAPDTVKFGETLKVQEYNYAKKYNHKKANQMIQNKQLRNVINNKSYRMTRQDALNGIDRARYIKTYLSDRDEYTYPPKIVLTKNQLPEYKKQVKIIDKNNKLSSENAKKHINNKKNQNKYHKHYHKNYYNHRFHRHYNTHRVRVNKFMSRISPRNRNNVKSLINNLSNYISTGNKNYRTNALRAFGSIKSINSNDSRFLSTQHLSHMSPNKLKTLIVAPKNYRYHRPNRFMSHISPKNRNTAKSLISNLSQYMTTGNKNYESNAVKAFNNIKNSNPNDSKFLSNQRLSQMNPNKLMSLLNNRSPLSKNPQHENFRLKNQKPLTAGQKKKIFQINRTGAGQS